MQPTTVGQRDQRLFHVAEVVIRRGHEQVCLIQVRVEDQGAPARLDRRVPVELALARHGRACQVGFGEVRIGRQRGAGLGLRPLSPRIRFVPRREAQVHVGAGHC